MHGCPPPQVRGRSLRHGLRQLRGGAHSESAQGAGGMPARAAAGREIHRDGSAHRNEPPPAVGQRLVRAAARRATAASSPVGGERLGGGLDRGRLHDRANYALSIGSHVPALGPRRRSALHGSGTVDAGPGLPHDLPVDAGARAVHTESQMATLLHERAPGESAGDALRDADPGWDAGPGVCGSAGRLGAAARNVSLVLGGQAGLSASRFAALLLVSHLVTAARFAECAIYVSSSLVVGNLCELGVNISCLKFAAGAIGEDWLRTVARFLRLRLALTAAVIAAAFLLAPLASARLLHHPEYGAAVRYACGSAAVASVSAFSMVLLQSRLEFGRMARLNASAAVLQIVPVLLVPRFRGAALAALFAGDLLSRLWIVAANLGLLAAAMAASRLPGPRPAWKRIAVFANWITLSTLIGALYNYIPSIALARWSSAAALGTYSLGLSLAGGFALVINTASTVL